jgi:hypothetical protein
MKVIKAVMFANGQPCPHAGMFLKAADFNAHDGQGFMTFTAFPENALQFQTAGEALMFWRTQSKVRRFRPDGRPNRPLTALTIEIEDAPP